MIFYGNQFILCFYKKHDLAFTARLKFLLPIFTLGVTAFYKIFSHIPVAMVDLGAIQKKLVELFPKLDEDVLAFMLSPRNTIDYG